MKWFLYVVFSVLSAGAVAFLWFFLLFVGGVSDPYDAHEVAVVDGIVYVFLGVICATVTLHAGFWWRHIAKKYDQN